VHYEPKVRQHHSASGFNFVFITVTASKLLLEFEREHGYFVDLLDVGIQAAGSRGNQKMAWYKIFAH
jgi:hypothetical protein